MFLSQFGHSKRFTFDIIYSALQKSLRRGNLELAIEMGYEFIDYPNALKKRLIQNCTEDCPDLILINEIFNTPADLHKLMPFIPVICKHVKNHDGCFGMRVAIESKPISSPPKLGPNHDDLLTMLRKLYAYICQKEELKFISFFQPKNPQISLSKIYTFIDKHVTFLYSLCVWETVDYVHEKYQLEPFDFDENKQFDNSLKLPDYIFDKHVRSGPIENKTISFFLDNLILFPREEESQIEKDGRNLYMQSNKGVGEFLKMKTNETIKKKEKCQKRINQMFDFVENDKTTKPPKNSDNKIEFNNIEISDHLDEEKVELIQTQLVSKSSKPKCYFCSLNNGISFDFILKGPYLNQQDLIPQLLSDKIKQKLLPMPKLYASKEVTYKNQIYLISYNFIPIEKYNTIIQSSKFEENSIVYNGNKFFFSYKFIDSLSQNETIELLKVLAYRKIIGSDDTFSKNILYCNNHIFSIDDAVTLAKMPYMFVMHLSKFQNSFNKAVLKYFNEICQFLNEWKKIIEDADDIPDNVKTFSLAQISNLMIKNNWRF